jgi:hypothetical protein
LLNAVRAELDQEKRKALYEQLLQILVRQDRPRLFLWHHKNIMAHSARLIGYRPVPAGLIRVQDLRLEWRRRRMWIWLARRLGQILPSLLVLSFLIFGLQQLMPGPGADPVREGEG